MIRRIYTSQDGIVMPSVVSLIFIILLLGASAFFLVQSQSTMGLKYSNVEKSLHFAEAGLNKYLWHLNKDSGYYKKESYSTDEAQPQTVTQHQNGYYYLEIIEPTTDIPVVTIKATGWHQRDPSTQTTVEVQVHKRQFVQYLFVTHEELTPNASTVWWITGDVVAGPFHTNGSININGNPSFLDKATYSGAAPTIATGSNPSFAHTGDPEGPLPQLTFPSSNSQLKTQAKLNGYYYNGRTSIYLQGDRLAIRSWDIQTNTWTHQTNLPLPPNGVIYVDGVTSDVSGTQSKFNRQAANVFISGTFNGRLTVVAANDIYITHRDPTNPTYLDATQANGVVCSNTNFSGSDLSDDMLGLIAGRYIRIMHNNWPLFNTTGDPYTSNNNVAPENITIHAAIFALDWAFEFERYQDNSPRGTINIVGSITQKYRGAVGTFFTATGARASGYLKNYSHDSRMAYDSPPHFLEPTNSGWEILSWQLTENPEIAE